jgi:hypothetical protein
MATLTNSEVDSRAYAFVYPIRGPEHLPADFWVQVEFHDLIFGIFLPQERCGWLNRPRYPARILLLLPNVLIAATHPSAGEAEVRIPISEILTIEVMRILLDGRLTVNTATSTHQWRYNTREGRHVDQFLFHLRQLVMPQDTNPRKARSVMCGSPLDLKFAAAETSELDPGEHLLVSFFCASRQSIVKHWFFDTQVSQPGDYVARTSRRLLWITDRNDGHRAAYGTISTHTSWNNLLGMTLAEREGALELTVQLRGGLRWRIPVHVDLRQAAAAFVNEVRWLDDGSNSERNS